MMKRNIILLFTGLLVWGFSSIAIYPFIVKLIVNRGYPVFLNEVFFFCQYLIIGFMLGFWGKSKGWILGCALGGFIAICFVLLEFTNPIHKIGMKSADRISSLGAIILSHSIFTVYLIIGGYIGELQRNRKLRETRMFTKK